MGTNKDAVFEGMSTIAKAVGSARRLALLELLANAPRSVDALARASSMSVANTSQHLQVLKRAGLVIARRDGMRVRYAIAAADVDEFLLTLRALAERSIAGILALRPVELEETARAELLERVRRGEVTVLDVRPSVEYEQAHLPGALSIPFAELEARLDEIPTGREVVAYCRGPYCALAADAVELLLDRGLPARHLSDGVIEWRHRGLPLETAEGR